MCSAKRMAKTLKKHLYIPSNIAILCLLLLLVGCFVAEISSLRERGASRFCIQKTKNALVGGLQKVNDKCLFVLMTSSV